jgi:hypothetical protein
MFARKYVIPVGLAAVACVLGVSRVGGPISWDELGYMELSLNTVPDAHILNRYSHIYFQKAFFWMAGDPLLGAKIFWCFLVSLTGLLIYANARLLSRSHVLPTGLVAVLLFCSQCMVFRYAGVTYADFTVMMWTALGLAMYLLFVRSRGRYRGGLLIALGFIFFLAVKSKESGVCLGILFAGLGVRDGTFHFPSLLRHLGLVALGTVLGGGLLSFLDYTFLHDPWFWIRPANFRAVANFNFGTFLRASDSYFTYMTSPSLLLPILLYLIVPWKAFSGRFSYPEKVAWLLPLAFVAFLTLTMISSLWNVIDRYLLPVLPVMDAWAAQFFAFDDDLVLRKRRRRLPGLPSSAAENILTGPAKDAAIIAVLALAFGLALYFEHYLYDFGARFGWQENILHAAVVCPLAVCVLLGTASLRRKWGWATLFIAFLSLALIVGNLIKTYNLPVLRYRTIARDSERRFYPLTAFSDKIRFHDGIRILVSKDIFAQYEMLGKYDMQHAWFFNLRFRQHLTPEQVVPAGDLEPVRKGTFSYVFLTRRDWEKLERSPGAESIARTYRVFADGENKLRLLRSREWERRDER